MRTYEYDIIVIYAVLHTQHTYRPARKTVIKNKFCVCMIAAQIRECRIQVRYNYNMIMSEGG